MRPRNPPAPDSERSAEVGRRDRIKRADRATADSAQTALSRALLSGEKRVPRLTPGDCFRRPATRARRSRWRRGRRPDQALRRWCRTSAIAQEQSPAVNRTGRRRSPGACAAATKPGAQRRYLQAPTIPVSLVGPQRWPNAGTEESGLFGVSTLRIARGAPGERPARLGHARRPVDAGGMVLSPGRPRFTRAEHVSGDRTSVSGDVSTRADHGEPPSSGALMPNPDSATH
jgi:hypothetical protein